MEYSDYPLSSWTLRKVGMYDFCPRCAVLHYCTARAGAAVDAPEHLRYLHSLKLRISRREYVRRLCRKLLRELFYLDPESQTELEEVEIYRKLLHRFEREYTAMLTGQWQLSAQKPILLELFQPECRPTLLASEIKTELEKSAAAIGKTVLPLLRRVPPQNKRHLPTVLETHINELCCYFSPLMVFEQDGTLWFVENGNRDDRVALLHKFYALNVLNRAPERVASFSVDFADGSFVQFGMELDISQSLRQIISDCSVWEAVRQLSPETISGNRKNCKICKFQEFCKQES